MPRLIAVIVAVLALLGAGWWGWSNPDLLPEGLRNRLPGATPEITATRPPPRPAPPAAAVAPKPEPAAPPAAPATALTPVPQDAPLPPETGSATAIETERVAEAAIAAANARAEAAALARAESEALEAAKQQISTALAPLLAANADPSAIRARLDGLTVPADPVAARVQSALLAEIVTALNTAPGQAESAAPASGTTAAPTDPAALARRIEDLLK